MILYEKKFLHYFKCVYMCEKITAYREKKLYNLYFLKKLEKDVSR